jgi:hypothetical protein
MYIDIDYNFEGDKLAVAGKSGEVFTGSSGVLL